MQAISVPRLGPVYWATLALASVFGTNTGDMISHTLHLGDDRGLPALAIAFAAIVVAERFSRIATTLYYWLAIILVRTAATNLADLGTLQLELDYEWFIAVIAALLVAILLARRWWSDGRRDARALPLGIPKTDGGYWLAMLTAATLGTALGDDGSHTLTLRVCVVLTLAVLAAALWAVRRSLSDGALYWVAIVAARAAGTNVGDWLAFKRGLNLGLPVSTALTGLLFFAAVAFGHRRAAALTRSA